MNWYAISTLIAVGTFGLAIGSSKLWIYLLEQFRIRKIEEKIEPHETYPYFYLKGDSQKIPYCATCWGCCNKLIRITVIDSFYSCNNCEIAKVSGKD